MGALWTDTGKGWSHRCPAVGPWLFDYAMVRDFGGCPHCGSNPPHPVMKGKGRGTAVDAAKKARMIKEILYAAAPKPVSLSKIARTLHDQGVALSPYQPEASLAAGMARDAEITCVKRGWYTIGQTTTGASE